jgi:thiol-disulfide isomerase/thioredoxin
MLARALDLTALDAALLAATPPSGRLLVHHFATWCEPCEEELPLLAATLAAAKSANWRSVAIAWDLFMVPAAPSEAVRVVSEFLDRLGARFDELVVYTGSPEELFERHQLASGTVPFTELRDDSGRRIVAFDAPLFEPSDHARLARALAQKDPT